MPQLTVPAALAALIMIENMAVLKKRSGLFAVVGLLLALVEAQILSANVPVLGLSETLVTSGIALLISVLFTLAAAPFVARLEIKQRPWVLVAACVGVVVAGDLSWPTLSKPSLTHLFVAQLINGLFVAAIFILPPRVRAIRRTGDGSQTQE